MKIEKLNENEKAVLCAMFDASADNGHDFGLLDEVIAPEGMSKKELGGYITDLNRKGLVFIDQPTMVNREYWIQQFIIEDCIIEELGGKNEN